MNDPQVFDYIVAGGGLAGCVVASRLKQARPDLSIALIETGPQDTENALVNSPSGILGIATQYPHLYHAYTTVPQPSLAGRAVTLFAGRMVGGGSAVNYAGYNRGHRADYDRWAELVGDQDWSYDALLPYFKKSETYHDTSEAAKPFHGYDGPIHTSGGGRNFPLEKDVYAAMSAMGMPWNADNNSGSPNGIGTLAETWYKGKRSFAANSYNLDGVSILTESHVHKLLLEEGSRCTGVQLTNGAIVKANKEVILSCGAARTPQLLMLSGIGPRDELDKHGIPVTLELPVGHHLRDHFGASLYYKLRNPERGQAVGSPMFTDPAFAEGTAMDYFTNWIAPDSALAEAAKADGSHFVEGTPRTDFEITVVYMVMPNGSEHQIPMDGTHISVSAMQSNATSTGRLTLQSTDPKDAPILDPAYMSTEHDRTALREGLRWCCRIMETEAGQRISTGQTAPGDLTKLDSTSTDAEFDERSKRAGISFNHLSGTASMGSVVDTKCKVRGATGLRVIDASIIPLSLSAHLQHPTYCIAEKGADLVLQTA